MKHAAWLIVVAAAALGLAAGAWVRYGLDGDEAPVSSGADAGGDGPSPAEIRGEPRPAFALPDLDGQQRRITAFEGQVVLLNFWATWCPPCVEEMPALDALQDELGDQGLQVVGVALDGEQAVRRFAEAQGIDYPLLIGGRKAYQLLRSYGNQRTTLPYSVVIDRSGVVRAVRQGALTRAEASELVRPHL